MQLLLDKHSTQSEPASMCIQLLIHKCGLGSAETMCCRCSPQQTWGHGNSAEIKNTAEIQTVHYPTVLLSKKVSMGSTNLLSPDRLSY